MGSNPRRTIPSLGWSTLPACKPRIGLCPMQRQRSPAVTDGPSVGGKRQIVRIGAGRSTRGPVAAGAFLGRIQPRSTQRTLSRATKTAQGTWYRSGRSTAPSRKCLGQFRSLRPLCALWFEPTRHRHHLKAELLGRPRLRRLRLLQPVRLDHPPHRRRALEEVPPVAVAREPTSTGMPRRPRRARRSPAARP